MSIAATRSQRILIVDDNPAIHEDIRKVFRPEPSFRELDAIEAELFGQPPSDHDEETAALFEIDSAYQGQEAFQLVKQSVARRDRYDIAIVDMRMPPGWDGVETIQHIWQADPDVQVIICTALSDYTWGEVTACLSNSDKLLILKKPFEACELAQAARALSEKRRLLKLSKNTLRTVQSLVQERTEELRLAHQEADLLLSAISSVLIWLDEHSRVTRWNSAATNLFELTAAEVLGQPMLELPITWDTPELLKRLIVDHYAEAPRHEEVVFTNRQGRQTTLCFTSYAINSQGSFRGVLLLANDRTQEKLLEQQLHQAQKLESVGQLAAGVAHEINTPMQYIGDNVHYLRRMFSQLTQVLEVVRDAHASPEADPGLLLGTIKQATTDLNIDRLLNVVPEAFEDVEQGIQHVSRIVRAMKEFSHPGRDFPEAVDVNHALRTTALIAKNEWKYVADVELDLDDTLPPLVGFPQELNQVFLNLLVNAAHAIGSIVEDGHKGQIVVTTRRRGDSCRVQIHDTGGGIPSAIRKRVFDPFFTTKQIGKGTGQGLAIAHQVIVQQHSGRLWFETEEGVGTTFFLEIPLTRPATQNESGQNESGL